MIELTGPKASIARQSVAQVFLCVVTIDLPSAARILVAAKLFLLKRENLLLKFPSKETNVKEEWRPSGHTTS